METASRLESLWGILVVRKSPSKRLLSRGTFQKKQQSLVPPSLSKVHLSKLIFTTVVEFLRMTGSSSPPHLGEFMLLCTHCHGSQILLSCAHIQSSRPGQKKESSRSSKPLHGYQQMVRFCPNVFDLRKTSLLIA